jgi:hypothetical protein
MNSKSTSLILALFGVLALAGIIALTVLHDPVPAILEFVATGTLSALAGISVPLVSTVHHVVDQAIPSPAAPTGAVVSQATTEPVVDPVSEAAKIFPL